MGEILPLLVLFLALVGVYFIMLGGLRRKRYVPKTRRGVSGLRMPDTADGLPSGLVATLAMVTVIAALGVESITVFALCGAAVGVVALVGRRGRPTGMLFDVLGFGAIIATVAGLVAPHGCAPTASITGWTLAAVCTLLASGLVAYALGLMTRFARPVGVPLAVFALLDIVVFFAVPLGVPLMAQSPLLLVPTVIVAALFGLFGAMFPAIVLGLGAVGVSLTSIAIAAGFGTSRSPAGDWAPLIGLTAFAVVYAIGVSLVRRKP